MNSLLDLKDYMADLVYEYVPGVRRVGSSRLNFKCPICGDGKKSTSHRGWFYIDTGSYFCWNAGCPANEKGMNGLQFLSAVSGKSISEIKSELVKRAGEFSSALSRYEPKSLSSLFNESDAPVKKQKCVEEKLKDGEWTEELPLYAQKYIDGRKLQKATYLPSWFKFYFDKKLRRLVIPWSDDYYQERTILKSQSKEEKYRFPFGVEKPIFGLDMIDDSFKYIFLCEGVFDAVWCKNAVAVGSLRLSNHQSQILDKYRKDFTIVWMPDNQFSDKSSYEKTLDFVKKSPYENVFIWPKELKRFKDVNESIMYSDKFIDIWRSEKFLTNNISNGLLAQMKMVALKQD